MSSTPKPRLTSQITLRVDKATKRQIELGAREADRTTSDYARLLIVGALRSRSDATPEGSPTPVETPGERNFQ